MMIHIKKDVESIFESIDGFLLIDHRERIVYMGRGLLSTIGAVSLADVRGKRLRDVIPTNRTHLVLASGQRQIGVTYLVQGHVIVSNAYPIFRDGTLIGALEYDVFEDATLLRDFFEKFSTKKGVEHFGTAIINVQKRDKYSLDSIKGSSDVIRGLKEQIILAGRNASTVLISGETGTGKELIAHAVHTVSQRSFFDFALVNCAAIPGELFESELFGYEEGSFTGAKKGGKPGLIAAADKGTLFLDEVDALPLRMQAKLLRFIQEREIQRVGGEKPVSVDVRIIAATNANLKEMVRAGTFREDLYYRLNIIEITATPLRSHKSDIPELVNSFIEELNQASGRGLESNRVRSISGDALKMLLDYNWPGNIRELRNAIERAMNRCTGVVLTRKHFDGLSAAPGSDGGGDLHDQAEYVSPSENLKELKRNLEIRTISRILSDPSVSITLAAKRLGITRQMLNRKIREFGIRRRPKDEEG